MYSMSSVCHLRRSFLSSSHSLVLVKRLSISRFMLRHSYDAVFLTEDFGTGRVVELPNGRRMVYEKAPEVKVEKGGSSSSSSSSSSSYVAQKIVWVKSKWEHQDEAVKSKAELR